MKQTRAFLLVVTVLALFASCDSGTEWENDTYEVYWIDISTDLTLGIKHESGGAIGRVMPTVYAIGENDRWIIAARHPDGDKSVKEFFYILKAADDPSLNAKEVVKGPFSEAEFVELKTKLKLPDWSTWFDQ